ncbi:MAG: DUF3341 domain-containing protein [Bacteroidia bacterium]
MDDKKLLLGVYDNPDTTYDATEFLMSKGYDIKDVYSPFAIHGIERVLKIKRTRLSAAAFVFALLGIASAISLIMYTGFFDWQINVGGKPFMHLPTYIPITFELGVLFTAFGMVACFFVVNHMFWGRNTDVIDIRVTDDKFVIAVNVHSNTDVKALEKSLIDNGAIEVRERIIEL